jgi:hypothetical protein
MGHWQVQKLRIADFWSENAQDLIYQRQNNPVIKKGRNYTSTRTFFSSSPLGIWRSNQR